MAATATVADATPAPALAMMSDADMTAWIERYQRTRALQPGAIGLDPGGLRAACPEGRPGLWHAAGLDGRTDVCEYLKSKGLLDLIEGRDSGGWTPLHAALSYKKEETARWMMDHGADVNAVDRGNYSVFHFACRRMNPSFVEELAGKVAPEHLTMCSIIGR